MKKISYIYLLSLIIVFYYGCNNDSTSIINSHSGNFPPNVPGNPSPHDSSHVSPGTQVTLIWTGGDPDVGDTARYDVYLSITNPPGTQVANNSLITAYDLGIPAIGTYYWKIIARDKSGATTAGPVWKFIVSP